MQELRPFQSVALTIGAGGQSNFVIRPDATRNYEIRTFGASDTVIVLFEDDNGELRYLAGDDDSGEDLNASYRSSCSRAAATCCACASTTRTAPARPPS